MSQNRLGWALWDCMVTVPRDKAEGAASQAKVREALTSLTDMEMAHLRYRAKFWAGSLGRHAAGRDWEDLLNEALTRLLSGQRSWNPEIGIVQVIDQAMRSIRSSWSEKGERSGVEALVSVAPTDAADDEGRVTVVPATESPESLAADRELIDQIQQLFADDEDAQTVLTGYDLGMKGPELLEVSGLSRKEFEAARRRIRRGIVREGLKNA